MRRGLAGLLLVGLVMAGCAGRRAPEPEPSPAATALQVAAFEHAWERIRDTYPHPDFRGLDWDAVREELLPRARRARTAREVRPIIEEMLARLGESHFQVIPRAAFEAEEGGEDAAASSRAGERSSSASLDPEAGEAGEVGDVGLSMTILGDDVVVLRVEPGGPADVAGIRPGFRLLTVQGVDVRERLRAARRLLGETPLARLHVLSDVTSLLQGGPPGSEVATLVGTERGGRRRVTLEREPRRGVPVKVGHAPTFVAELSDEILTGPGGAEIGTVRFNIWMTPIAAPFTRAIERFVDRGVDGIVIDLRGNPGGIGGMVMGLGGHFVREPGVSLGRMTMRGAELDFVANPRAVAFDGPVAILVDELSLSTSELFASGMQDIGRARIFGTPTPGMALPSVVERLPNGDRLQFVVADLVTPSGRRIEGDGVRPDEPVTLTREGLLAGRDEVLAAAARWIDDAAGQH